MSIRTTLAILAGRCVKLAAKILRRGGTAKPGEIALKLCPDLPARLSALACHMRDGLKKRGIAIMDGTTPIIPIYTYDTERTFVITKQLYEAGVYVNPVIPPATPEGYGLLRTSYMATHTEALLDEALEIIAGVLKNYDLVKEVAATE